MEYRALGPLEVLDGSGHKLPLGGVRQQTVLASLLLRAGQTVGLERLVDELWEEPPATAARTVQAYVSRLRHELPRGAIESRPGGYRLVLDGGTIDLETFERRAEEGRRALAEDQCEEAGRLLRSGLALWRGPALAGLTSEALRRQAERLEELRLTALEDRLEADLRCAREAEIVPELKTLVAEHPFRERLRAQLMRALYRSGRPGEALALYRDTRRLLVGELGMEPGQELRDLEQAILRQDAELEAPRRRRSTAPAQPATPRKPEPPVAREPRRERRVITVVFADIVGFTERAEQLDPEDVEALLEPYQALLREELERYGGVVEKFAGDAVMAIFGAPIAHEDDPARGVRAALAIRDAIRENAKLEVRLAVHTGEAIVRLDAEAAAGETFATGDVLNTASRLQEAAPVNGVVVGEATYKATRQLVDYRQRAPVRAKGKAAPIKTWEATRISQPNDGVRSQRGTPLVGRKRELMLLCETLAHVESQRAPQLVTLLGVPGIGKSRLAYELVQSRFQGHAGRSWHQGRCLPYGDGVSFWAIAEIVKAELGIYERDEAKIVAEKLGRAVTDLVQAADVERTESALAPLVGLEGASTGDDRREELFSGWRRFLEAVAERQPLLMVIEDLHWADDGLLEFLDYLADWATGVPLMVLCTARPELLERRPDWGGGKTNAFNLGLSPLPDDDAARLIACVLDRAVLPTETRRDLLERAGGNPLYAEEFALLFLDRGSPNVPLPESVHALIAARLDTLPADDKKLLQDAAVVGRVFWSGALRADEALADRLHVLERKEFIRRERHSSVAGEEEYVFRHVLVRDVAYGQIPRPERARQHDLTAKWIESLGRPQDHAELLAHHYTAALQLARASGVETPALGVRARDALRDAGDRALSLNSFASAIGFYSSALDLTPEADPARALVLFRLGEARFNHEHGGDDVLVEAVAALVAAGNPEPAAEAQVMLSHLAWAQGERDEAFRHLERAAGLLDGLAPSPAKMRVLSEQTRHFMLVSADRGFRAVIRFVRGDSAGALDETARALEDARHINDPHVLWGALAVRSWMLMEAGMAKEAGALVDELVADERIPAAGRFYIGHPLAVLTARALGRAKWMLAWIVAGHPPRTRWLAAVEAVAAGDLARAADVYESLGHRPLEAQARLVAAREFIGAGRKAEAQEQLERARVLFRSGGATRFVQECDARLTALAAS